MRRSKKVAENYVCPKCFNQIQNCTCDFYPPWQLIMVDIGMQEVVRILNQKGYRTIGCCESHFDREPNMYIAFSYHFDLPLPEGFCFAKSKTNILYPFKSRELASKEKYNQIKTEKLNALLEWAKALPDNADTYRR